MSARLLFSFFLCYIFTFVFAHDSEVAKFMKHLEVIPDLIDEGPQEFLKVNFENGIFADKGIELKPSQVKNQPNLRWQAETGAFYTLIFTDLDAPSRLNPSAREWHHWLVGNIPGNDLSKGDVLTQYVGSGPPKDSGLHRYVFLLYKQPKKLVFDEPRLKNNSVDGRARFSTKNFVQKYGLGVPIAGNFYQAQYDDYVPILYKQLNVNM